MQNLYRNIFREEISQAAYALALLKDGETGQLKEKKKSKGLTLRFGPGHWGGGWD